MKNLTIITGLTENEIKSMYLNAIKTAKMLGFSEAEARQIVQESFKEALYKVKNCKCIRFVNGNKYYNNGCKIHKNDC